MDIEMLSKTLTALSSPIRLRAIKELADGPLHVSELARRIGISRPLLYMHLNRLEESAIVSGQLRLSDSGTAIKEYTLKDFEITLNVTTIKNSTELDVSTQQISGA